VFCNKSVDYKLYQAWSPRTNKQYVCKVCRHLVHNLLTSCKQPASCILFIYICMGKGPGYCVGTPILVPRHIATFNMPHVHLHPQFATQVLLQPIHTCSETFLTPACIFQLIHLCLFSLHLAVATLSRISYILNTSWAAVLDPLAVRGLMLWDCSEDMMMTSRVMGMMREVLKMIWVARYGQEELVGTRMAEIDRQGVEIWVDVGRKYIKGVVNDQSDGSTISSDPWCIEHNGPTIKEIRPEDDELWQERGDWFAH